MSASPVIASSIPGAFPFLSFLTAASTSAVVKSSVLIGRSISASGIGFVVSVLLLLLLLSRVLKYDLHSSSISALSLASVPSCFLTVIVRFFLFFPVIFLMIL